MRTVAILGATVCLACGCATMISGRYQTVTVSSQPPDAEVSTQPGGAHARTPGRLVLRRDSPDYRLTFTKEGYEPAEVWLRQGINPWLWGSFLLLSPLTIVDFQTGAGYRLSPPAVEVRLLPSASPPADR